jgi:hypothetical protein
VRFSLERYQFLASGTSDPAIRAKLLAPFGSRATVDKAGSIEVTERPEAAGSSTPRWPPALHGRG